MLNTDKVKGILRAKYGSQVPKFQSPHGPIINNPYMLGSNEVIKKEKEIPPINLDELKVPEWKGPSTLRKTGLLIGNFAKNNPNLVAGGLDVLGNAFNKGITNNSGTLKIFGIGDTVANGLMTVNPVAGLIGKGAMTVVKGINNLFGSRTNNFSADLKTIEEIGGSYGGSVADINEAASKAGKKYGLFSSGSRKAANRLINSANYLQNIMADIAEDARNQKAMINDLNYLGYNMDLMGGYDQRYMRAAKSGMKLLDKINFIKLKRILNSFINLDTKLVEEFKEGGKLTNADWEPEIELFEEWEPVIDIFQKGGKTRTLEELIEYAKKENPRFVQRLSEEPRGIKFIDDEGNGGEGSHYLEWSTDDFGNAVIYPRIQEIEDGSLKFFPSNEAYLRAIKTKNMLIMSPEEANTFFSEDPEYKTAYKKGWPNFFKLFKDGGKTKEELETPEIEETNQKNLIPEGALHKNKHHMEHTEGLTLKGIPVIDNDGEQLAEIELDEIIFTLEVTKKLEELYKKGTDEAAIEAGKLLVKEILFNTDDRTGLISKCKKGGKICQEE